jgi:hypothetical protein
MSNWNPGHQFSNPTDRMALGDPGECIAQIGLGVQAIELGRLYDRIDRRGSIATSIGASEEIILTTKCY